MSKIYSMIIHTVGLGYCTYLKSSLAVVVLYLFIGPPEQENSCTAILNDNKDIYVFLLGVLNVTTFDFTVLHQHICKYTNKCMCACAHTHAHTHTHTQTQDIHTENDV